MRTQIKWMVSLVFAIVVFAGNAQTSQSRNQLDSKISFKARPSIEKRMNRTVSAGKSGILPVNHKKPSVVRKTKGK